MWARAFFLLSLTGTIPAPSANPSIDLEPPRAADDPCPLALSLPADEHQEEEARARRVHGRPRARVRRPRARRVHARRPPRMASRPRQLDAPCAPASQVSLPPPRYLPSSSSSLLSMERSKTSINVSSAGLGSTVVAILLVLALSLEI